MAQMFNPFMWQQSGNSNQNRNPNQNPNRNPNQNSNQNGNQGMGMMPGQFGMMPGQGGPWPGMMQGRQNTMPGQTSWNQQRIPGQPLQNQHRIPGQQSPTQQRTPTQAPSGMLSAMQPGSNKTAEAIRKQKEENLRVLDPSQYKETNISKEDLSRIVALYGNDIENIYNLSPGQMWMYDRGHTPKQVQIMQFVCRAKVNFEPASFRQNIYAVQKSHDNLRTAIVFRNMEKPYKVVIKNRNMDYLLIDSANDVKADDEDSVNKFINKLINEDCKRGFDLENDPLIRINVHKIAEDDYVFLISQPHINTDGSSLGIMIKELFIDYALELNGIDMALDGSSYKEYARHMMTVDKEKQLLYWKEKLAGYTENTYLPGYQANEQDYVESEYGIVINEDSFKKIKALQSPMKKTLFSILQAAWTVALSQITGNKDILFGIIISGRSADVEGSMTILGGFAELVPVRVQISDDDTLEDIVNKVSQATTEAEKNADCPIREIEEFIGREQPLVTHDLNFHNFSMPKVNMFKGGALKGFELLSGSMHISHLENLSVIFSQPGNELLCNFHYNLNCYMPYTIMITASYFRNVLMAIATGSPQMKYSDFPEPDREMFDIGRDSYQLTVTRKTMVFKNHELFKDLSAEELDNIARKSKMVGYMKGAMVFDPDDELDDIPLLNHGKVSIQSGNTDEWRRVSEILTGNSILTCSALTGEKTGVIATVESNQTEIMFIPRDAFMSILKDHEDFALKLAVYMEKQTRHNANEFEKMLSQAE